ncbi:MAG: phosphotransferase [Lachnospiraceae bacterium]
MSQLKFISKEPINKGWSHDKKYCAITADGTKYFLRVIPEKNSNPKDMFDIQQKVASLDISVSKPVEFGIYKDNAYIVEKWINGRDASEVISALPDSQQYTYGLWAGRILKKIHSIPAPGTQPEWESRFNAKINRNINMYKECPIQFERIKYFIDYIKTNRSLLANRPQTFQHGDYHIGNMMIEDNKIIIIDFNRYDFGDPWEEFNRIVWCAQISPLFASGMVNGYFDNKVPDLFWKLLALYISSNTLGSIPWAVPFGKDEINTMLHQAEQVLDWYDNMKNPVPKWYFTEDSL